MYVSFRSILQNSEEKKWVRQHQRILGLGCMYKILIYPKKKNRYLHSF